MASPWKHYHQLPSEAQEAGKLSLDVVNSYSFLSSCQSSCSCQHCPDFLLTMNSPRLRTWSPLIASDPVLKENQGFSQTAEVQVLSEQALFLLWPLACYTLYETQRREHKFFPYDPTDDF